jgi:hypothetical protein
MCPICTVGLGAGISLSRYLGISDLISGLWIGAFIGSVLLISIKRWYLFIISVSFFIYMVISYEHFITKELSCGTALGIVLFSISYKIDNDLRENKRPLFSFQKVIIPLAILLIFSLFLYLLTNF